MSLRKNLNFRSIYVRAGTGIFALTVAYAGGAYLTYRTADSQLKKGFGALAAETVQPYRWILTRFETGCNVVLNAYFSAHLSEKLEWASQACMDHGFEGPGTYVGIAASYEFRGRDDEALRVLTQVASKFEHSPDLYYRAYTILRRNQKPDLAIASLMKATERAPNNPEMTFEAVRYLADLERWKDARPLADRLKGIKTENPEAKLILARVFQKSGDMETARTLTRDGASLVTPELRAAVEKNYGELFKATAVNPADFIGRGLASSAPAGMAPGTAQAQPPGTAAPGSGIMAPPPAGVPMPRKF
ncbi:MAG: tetratricopeptide repeat protein [Bdellovibrionota bacterium]